MVENVDITLLTRLCQDTLAETRAIRSDLADVQRLAVRTVDVLTRMAQHNDARFATIDARFGAIDDRFSMMDMRFAAIDSRFVAVDARLRGIDQRIADLKGELELTIKSELMSALGSFETRMVGLIEARFAGRD